jgi:chromosome segregation ATPase
MRKLRLEIASANLRINDQAGTIRQIKTELQDARAKHSRLAASSVWADAEAHVAHKEQEYKDLVAEKDADIVRLEQELKKVTMQLRLQDEWNKNGTGEYFAVKQREYEKALSKKENTIDNLRQQLIWYEEDTHPEISRAYARALQIAELQEEARTHVRMLEAERVEHKKLQEKFDELDIDLALAKQVEGKTFTVLQSEREKNEHLQQTIADLESKSAKAAKVKAKDETKLKKSREALRTERVQVQLLQQTIADLEGNLAYAAQAEVKMRDLQVALRKFVMLDGE